MNSASPPGPSRALHRQTLLRMLIVLGVIPFFGSNCILEDLEEGLGFIQQPTAEEKERRLQFMSKNFGSPSPSPEDIPSILQDLDRTFPDGPVRSELKTETEFSISAPQTGSLEGPLSITSPAVVNVVVTPNPSLRGQTINVVLYQGQFHIPESELVRDEGHGGICNEPHWHGKDRAVTTSVEGPSFPDAGGCGFGKISVTPLQPYTGL